MTRRKPSEYDYDRLLFDERLLTKHITRPRRERIRFVGVHHSTIVGNGNGRANDTMWNVWQQREASAHFGVDGSYTMRFVRNSDAAWATGNGHGNHAGISIEHHNSRSGPSWTISSRTWKRGARLAAYIHIAEGLGRPTSNARGSAGTLRKHSSFTSTACPGPYMDSIWGRYVAEAQRVYDKAMKRRAKAAGKKRKDRVKDYVVTESTIYRTGPGAGHPPVRNADGSPKRASRGDLFKSVAPLKRDRNGAAWHVNKKGWHLPVRRLRKR